MNPIEYFKKHTLAEAKEILSAAPENATHFDLSYKKDKCAYLRLEIKRNKANELPGTLDLIELKTVVESLEIIERFNGIDRAKAVAAVKDTHYMSCKLDPCDDLLKAIEIYEAVLS